MFRSTRDPILASVVHRNGKEKRSGDDYPENLRQQQPDAAAHSGRMSADVPLHLPGAPELAVHGRHQPHHHHVRGDRYSEPLVHARPTVPADIRVSPSEGIARGVHHEERGHSVSVPHGRVGHQRCCFRRRNRLLPQARRFASNAAGHPVSEKTFARQVVLNQPLAHTLHLHCNTAL